MEALIAEILGYLQGHNVMTIATVCDGRPQAADVFYANARFTFYFVSDPSTRHGSNLTREPWAALTVHEDYDDWRLIQGVQLEGPAGLVTSRREQVRAATLFLRKYPWARPFLAGPLSPSREIAQKTANVRFYRVTAHWVRFVNNTKGFGHHEDLILT